MKLSDVIPDADVLCALEPEELGLRMLPVLAAWDRRFNLLTLSGFLQVVQGNLQAPSGYPAAQSTEIEMAVREAWAWLEGAALLIEGPGYHQPNVTRVFSRRARQMTREHNAAHPFSARQIPKGALHPDIREDVWALYHRGKYDTAVFEAMKAVEVAVREAAGLSARDIGTDLMRTAFEPVNGPLIPIFGDPQMW